MSELVKWLRELQNSSLAVDTVFGEAADEIERLTAEIGRKDAALESIRAESEQCGHGADLHYKEGIGHQCTDCGATLHPAENRQKDA